MTEVRHGYKVTEQDRPDLPSAVIFRDSFMTAASQFFSESFRRVVYVAAGEGIHYDLIERERPDVVIHQMGERRLTSVPHEPSTTDFRATFGDLLLDDPKAIADQRRSRSFLAAGKLEEALAASNNVLGAVRPNGRTMLHRGRVYLALGRLDAAIEALRHATILDPTDAFLFFSLGRALAPTGHVTQALAACERAVEIEPRQVVFWPQAIIAALQADNASRAAQLATRALELFPDRADLHYADSCALVALGRLADAEASIRRAVSLAPEARLFKRYLASVLVRGEQWDEAQQVLLGLDTDSPAEAGLSESLAHSRVTSRCRNYARPGPRDPMPRPECCKMTSAGMVSEG
jgi:predicted Zn-dependent protease